MSFVHLHTHTTFSFGDGACRIPELVMRAAELGMTALAVTDHEGLYGAVRFYQACRAAGGRVVDLRYDRVSKAWALERVLC